MTARADDAEQKEILSGIAEAAFDANTDIAVYSNIYNHWVVDEQLNFENIYTNSLSAPLRWRVNNRRSFYGYWHT